MNEYFIFIELIKKKYYFDFLTLKTNQLLKSKKYYNFLYTISDTII